MKKPKLFVSVQNRIRRKLTQLLDAGMNVMRLNFSHGDYEEHGQRIKTFVLFVPKPANKQLFC